MHDRFRYGRQVAAMTVGRGVANIPQLAGDELIDRNAGLHDPFVAEERISIVADDVSLQVGKGTHDCPAARALEARLWNLTGKVKNKWGLGVLNTKIARW